MEQYEKYPVAIMMWPTIRVMRTVLRDQDAIELLAYPSRYSQHAGCPLA